MPTHTPASSPPPSETLTMNAVYDQNKYITLSGSLTGPSGAIANQTINFSGAVTGTATTNSQGNYTVTLRASNLGVVSGASADGQSNTAQATLASQAPDITDFTATSKGGGMWLFSGTVANGPAMWEGEVIDFGGIKALDGQTATVNQNGSFSFYAMVCSGQGGIASAEAVDWWGNTSDLAMAPVSC